MYFGNERPDLLDNKTNNFVRNIQQVEFSTTNQTRAFVTDSLRDFILLYRHFVV